MTIKKIKAYVFLGITDDLKKAPFETFFLCKSKREALRLNRSYHGHSCDNPKKRGVLCEATVTIRIPEMPPITPELVEYVQTFEGSPALLEFGNDDWNRKAFRNAKSEQARKLKILKR